jgi:hypothetical protein
MDKLGMFVYGLIKIYYKREEVICRSFEPFRGSLCFYS